MRFRLKVPHQARLYGPKGRIIVDDFFHPQGYRIEREDSDPEIIKAPYHSTGLQSAMEVQRCLAAGLYESPLCPLAESLGIIECMDRLLTHWGISYPKSSVN